MKKWQCMICGFIYDEAAGWPDDGIAPGTRWEDVPDDWMCPDCGVSKADFEMIEFGEDEQIVAAPNSADTAPVIIVGAGLAGYTAAREYRKLDAHSALLIVTRDDGRYYSKPMLSNAFAQERDAASLASATAEQMSAQLNATVLTETEIHTLEPGTHTLHTAAGSHRYSKLVLALGADPIRLPLAGDGAVDVMSVNDLHDYGLFREQLRGKRRIVIMGAGLIGCEFANDLCAAGYSVAVVDPGEWPLNRLVPRPVGEALQKGLSAHGVEWHLGTVVEHIERGAGGYRLSLGNGASIEADVVLSAIGLNPRTRLAALAGVAVERGIVVDHYLETNITGIFALGDCAECQGLVLPYVMPIMHAARALALTLSGQRTPVSYPAMPVVVKTPAHPVVVSPPPARAPGQWNCELHAGGVKALFRSHGGNLLGFALSGQAAHERQVLARDLPAVLP